MTITIPNTKRGLIKAINNQAKQQQPTTIEHTTATNKPKIKGDYGLTHKQETFAEAVAKGSTHIAAFRQAYDASNMKPEACHTRAGQLMRNIRITSRIAEIRQKIEEKQSHGPEEVRLMLREYFTSIVNNTREKTSDRTRAAELLGKVSGVSLFNDQPIDKPRQSGDAAKAIKDLQDKLSLLLAPVPQPISPQPQSSEDAKPLDHMN